MLSESIGFLMPSKPQMKEREGEGKVDEEVVRHKILRGEQTNFRPEKLRRYEVKKVKRWEEDFVMKRGERLRRGSAPFVQNYSFDFGLGAVLGLADFF
jgi:hypothetical protein